MDSFFQHFDAMLSPEEKAAAKECFEIYCKPIELYNILGERACKNPLFLNRCMSYKLQEKHKKRMQLITSLPVTFNNKKQIQGYLPLCIVLAKEISTPTTEDPRIFTFTVGRAWIINDCLTRSTSHAYAKFVLPEVEETLEKIKQEALSILFISAYNNMDLSSFPANVKGKCLVGVVPFELIRQSWINARDFFLGECAEFYDSITLNSYFIQSCCSEIKMPSFRLIPTFEDDVAPLPQLQVAISARFLWALRESSRDSHSVVGSTSLPNIYRIRSESVCFHFSYYNDKLHQTQVTQYFSCPCCSINCSNFEGLKCHLSACHDLFNFEYSVTDDVRDVYVSVNFDKWRPEIVGDGIDVREQTFTFSPKSRRHRKSLTVVKYTKNAKHVSDLGFRTAANELQHTIAGEDIHEDFHFMQSV